MGEAVSGLRLKVDNLYDAPLVAEQLNKTLPQEYMVSDWTQEYGAYFKAIRMENYYVCSVVVYCGCCGV